MTMVGTSLTRYDSIASAPRLIRLSALCKNALHRVL